MDGKVRFFEILSFFGVDFLPVIADLGFGILKGNEWYSAF